MCIVTCPRKWYIDYIMLSLIYVFAKSRFGSTIRSEGVSYASIQTQILDRVRKARDLTITK
jgi:hypothetical protein